jgi:hypothetical protein
MAADDERESARIAGGGWPFQRVADQLVANLLDSNWHVRHGAAVGLRQLLRAQASSAAVQVPVADPLSGALWLCMRLYLVLCGYITLTLSSDQLSALNGPISSQIFNIACVCLEIHGAEGLCGVYGLAKGL